MPNKLSMYDDEEILVPERIQFGPSYLDKLQRRATEKNQPRSQREELIDKFKTRLNVDCKADGYPPYTTGRLVKLFAGRTEFELLRIYQSCERAAKFGALMNHILKQPNRPNGAA